MEQLGYAREKRADLARVLMVEAPIVQDGVEVAIERGTLERPASKLEPVTEGRFELGPLGEGYEVDADDVTARSCKEGGISASPGADVEGSSPGRKRVTQKPGRTPHRPFLCPDISAFVIDPAEALGHSIEIAGRIAEGLGERTERRLSKTRNAHRPSLSHSSGIPAQAKRVTTVPPLPTARATSEAASQFAAAELPMRMPVRS